VRPASSSFTESDPLASCPPLHHPPRLCPDKLSPFLNLLNFRSAPLSFSHSSTIKRDSRWILSISLLWLLFLIPISSLFLFPVGPSYAVFLILFPPSPHVVASPSPSPSRVQQVRDEAHFYTLPNSAFGVLSQTSPPFCSNLFVSTGSFPRSRRRIIFHTG